MGQSVEVFKFHRDEVRVFVQDGEPWFVACDIGDLLGVTTRFSVRGIPDKHKRKVPRKHLGMVAGGEPMWLLSEPGMYLFVLRSRSPLADEFQDWVTEDVLPRIRKTGAYIPDGAIVVRNGKELLSQAVLYAQKQIGKLEPIVKKYKALTESECGMTLLGASKTLGIGRNKLFAALRDSGILTKTTYPNGKNTNLPYQRFVDAGYFDVKLNSPYVDRFGREHVTTTTYITPKGMDYVRDKVLWGM